MSDAKNALVVATTAPLTLSNNLPDYLQGNERTGLEAFDKSDFRIPEIKLLQGNNPEIANYGARAVPNEYFHTGLVQSLGVKFRSIVCVARKRILVWRPKNDQGGGILAQSDDGINWKRGANQKFSVMLKGAKKPVVWDTKNNVLESGLLEFGSANPEDDNSPPAAVKYFEYVHYLPDHENGSPVVSRMKSTALPNAEKLNSYYLLQRKPVYVHAIEWGVEPKSGDGNTWTIPKFEPLGYVDKRTFEIVKQMHEQYADIELEIIQEGEGSEVSDKNSPSY